MMTTPFSNKALTAVCEVLLDEFEQTPEQIANLVTHIADECKTMAENRAEDAWQEQQERLMSDGGPHDGTHRDNIIQAGRGHLLK
jgi:hypothetical protein